VAGKRERGRLTSASDGAGVVAVADADGVADSGGIVEVLTDATSTGVSSVVEGPLEAVSLAEASLWDGLGLPGEKMADAIASATMTAVSAM
jgi:hypothetical protein